MPKRNRNHELETESQRAFEGALPANLVVRPISDDYGIDREVEVFVDGESTGLTLKVQLKATDKSGTSRRIKRDHLEYWRSLDVPVLLVSYEANTHALRGRWVHSIGADAPDTGANTLTVQMDPGITIADTWAARLANDLSLIRALRHGEVPNPTPVLVEVEDSSVSAAQVTAALLNLSRRTRVRMEAVSDPDQAAFVILIRPRRVQAALPLQFATSSLHMPDGLPADADPQTVAEMGMMLCAAAVAPVNEECARQWLLGVDPAAPWWEVPEFAERLMPVIAHRDTAALLLQIHANLVEVESSVADVYLMPTMDLVRDVDPDVFNAYSERIRQQIGPTWDGGRLAFNLSGLHRLRKDYATALELLDLAAERASRYKEDPLYFRFHGACLWEIGRFDESARSYRRALDLGFEAHELLPLLADSLLYAGRYEEARRTLEAWEPNGTTADKAGIIRLAILDVLLDMVGVAEQERASDLEQIKAIRDKHDQGSLDEASLLRVLREMDALHPLPWMLLGFDGEQVSLGPALITAFVLTDNPSVWVLALVGALEAEASEPLLRGIIDQARYLCGEEFYDAVLDFASHQADEQAEYLRELISAAYSSEPETFTNRLRALDPSKASWVLDVLQYPAT